MDNQILQYEDFVTRHEAAYAGFSRIYESKTPRPTKSAVKRDIVSLMIVIALAVVMGAAVIVSSSRTIDEFGGGAIGATAFIMIEGGIMVYALFRARRTASKERLQKTVKWATAGLILTFVIGVGANIDAALTHKGIILPKEVNIFIHFLVAISAPTLAFISSDVLAIELMAGEIKRRENELQYDHDMREWQEALNRSWSSQQKQWGVKIDVQPIPMEHPMESNGMLPAKSTLGHTKKPDAAKRVMDYLIENPDAINGSPLEIASILEVGKSTVYNVFKEVKDANK